MNRQKLLTHLRKWVRPVSVAACIAACLIVVAALVWAGVADPAPSPRADMNPLAGRQFYVDPQRDAVRAAYEYRRQGRADDANLLDRIAQQPGATWLAGNASDASEMRRVTGAAAADNSVALVVAYNIPHRDTCGDYSGGGAASGQSYREWLTSVSAAAQGPAVVIVEPDAVANLAHNCLPGDRAAERSDLLALAVKTFKRQKQVLAVYLDAANPGWFPDPANLVITLHRAGVGYGDGVSVNVSNFFGTDRVTAWVGQLIGLLNTSKSKYSAIIDTSRNGNGPYVGDKEWCNPPDRALGNRPTTDTGNRAIDAYAWVKVPGDSDGTCRGGPPAGTFWPENALDLARHSS